MKISRRDFLKYCGVSAAVLGLSGTDLLRLEQALADPNGPSVLWLQGSSCTGCSMSFLNYLDFGNQDTDAGDVLLSTINLAYHPNLMALAGEDAVKVAEDYFYAGDYILAVEGGVPSAFGGRACWAWSYNGEDITFSQAVQDLASQASHILAIGTCAAWGGIPAAGPNPTGVQGVSAATGKTTVNIGGCPPHPDWIIGTITRLLSSGGISVDGYGRPTWAFASTVHGNCPRRSRDDDAHNFPTANCLEELGCRGKATRGDCPARGWNNNQNWCINASAPCYACTEPSFPGSAFYQEHEGGGDD